MMYLSQLLIDTGGNQQYLQRPPQAFHGLSHAATKRW